MLVVAAVLFLLGCAVSGGPTADDRRESVPPGALEIELRFSEAADLDLFVTDPSQEAVYFGNNPSLAGGHLDRDQGCRDQPEERRRDDAPRVERVLFPTPRPGRYRVGVSYDRSCQFRRERVGYRIDVRSEALSWTSAGELSPGQFEPRALEFDFPGTDSVEPVLPKTP